MRPQDGSAVTVGLPERYFGGQKAKCTKVNGQEQVLARMLASQDRSVRPQCGTNLTGEYGDAVNFRFLGRRYYCIAFQIPSCFEPSGDAKYIVTFLFCLGFHG